MSNEKKPIYVGSGTQKFPDSIELVIYPDEIHGHIQETAKGKKIVKLVLSKRKTASEYGETHTIKIKQNE